jgi:hypothetical protein
VARNERKGWLAFNASVVDASNRGEWGSFARARGERGGRDAREREVRDEGSATRERGTRART